MITSWTEVVLYIQNKKNPDNKIFFLQRFEVLKNYFHKKKIDRIWRTKKKGEDLEEDKNNGLKLLEDQQKQKKIFSQTYILYDESGAFKPTFVTELHQEVNIFSEFIIFCQKKNDKNTKNFIKHNKKNVPIKKTKPVKRSFCDS